MSEEQTRHDPYDEGTPELDEQERSRRVITLLSDFGTDDNSVAVMKGVIFGVNSEVHIVDISHSIEPYNIEVGAEILMAAYHYFPRGTIHVAVVDPGVGGDRRGILVATENYFFVGPDNGIFSYIYEDPGFRWVRDLRAVDFFLEKVSSTFHGRDIFAPVAGYLSAGEDPEDFGPPIDDPVKLRISQSHVRPGGGIDGEVIYVDHFGNLITNICSAALEALGANVQIAIGSERIAGIQPSYAQAPPQTLLAAINSFEVLEIAVNQGNAAEQLQAGAGTPVRVNISAGG